MNKQVFIATVLILCAGVAVWFFVQKTKNAQKNDSFIIESTSPSPSSSAKANPMPNDQWITLAGGLKVLDVKIGAGREAVKGNAVAANYVGTLDDGTKFDSSYDRGKPFTFLLGAGQVIKGWDIGIEGMKVGGKRDLIIPPGLGYGDQNVGNGIIPPNSTLHFEVELVDVQDVKAK